MTAYEAETTINFNEEEGQAELYAASTRVYRLLAARGLEPYKVDHAKGEPCGWYYRLPKSAILIKPANRIIRIGGRRKVNAIASSSTLGAQIEKQSIDSKVVGTQQKEGGARVNPGVGDPPRYPPVYLSAWDSSSICGGK